MTVENTPELPIDELEDEKSTDEVDGILEENETSTEDDIKEFVNRFKQQFPEKFDISKIEVNLSEEEEVFKTNALNLIAESEDLKDKFSEDFLNSIVSEMETVVRNKVNSLATSKVQEVLKEHSDVLLETVIDLASDVLLEYQESATESIDNFLESQTQAFFEKNYALVENFLKNDFSEKLLSGIVKLFQENNVDFDETKIDLYQKSLQEKDELQKSYDNQIQENIDLKLKLKSLEKEIVLSENTKDLSLIEKDKLSKLLENVTFSEKDEYVSKIESFKKEFIVKDVLLKENNSLQTIQTFNEKTEEELKLEKMDTFDRVHYLATKQLLNK